MFNLPSQHPKDTPVQQDLAECRVIVKARQETLNGQSLSHPRVFNLARYLDQPLLKAAGSRLRIGAAPGVDQITPGWYREHLDMNINKLIEEVKNKSYQPSPARRVSIPKDDGTLRHLGLPTVRDKHLQGAVLALLEAIYEPHFYPNSYGFRPGRSGKMALQVLLDWLATHDGAWVLEVDLSKFFDTIPHDLLLAVTGEKIGDRTILHLIDSWLKAGIKDEGAIIPSEMGTPQGGVISPLAANVYLDRVLDQWMTKTYLPTLKGEGFLVRYADDFILSFTNEAECRQAAVDVSARLEEFGLTVNQAKTKITNLQKPCATSPGNQETAEINFLGFSVYWKPYPNTGWKLAARTSEKSIKRFTERLQSWLDNCGDLTPGDLTDSIANKVRGHRGYFDREGNEDSISLVEKMAHTMYTSSLTPPLSSSHVYATNPTAAPALAPYEDRDENCQPG
jgi:group II intron reverse transcriptase/maturase